MQEQTNSEPDSLLLTHKKKFSKCVKCPLGIQTLIHRKNLRVYYQGPIPCDVLVIGEYPTEIDLATGEPFSGPNGDLLKSHIESSLKDNFFLNFEEPYLHPEPSGIFDQDESSLIKRNGCFSFYPSRNDGKSIANIGFTTSVICPTCDSPVGKLRSPKKKETNACSPRLLDIITICDPHLLLVTGRVAERALLSVYPKSNPPIYYYVCSPASIIRQEEAGVIDIKRTKTTLSLLSQELRKLQDE